MLFLIAFFVSATAMAQSGPGAAKPAPQNIDMSHCQPEAGPREKALIDGKKFLRFDNDNEGINYLMGDDGQLIVDDSSNGDYFVKKSSDASSTYAVNGDLMVKVFHDRGLPTMFQAVSGMNTSSTRHQDFQIEEYTFSYTQRDGRLACYISHVTQNHRTSDPVAEGSKSDLIVNHIDSSVDLSKDCDHETKKHGSSAWWQCMDNEISAYAGSYFIKDVYGKYPEATYVRNTTARTTPPLGEGEGLDKAH